MVNVAEAVLLPFGVTEPGLMRQVASPGAPAQVSATAWLKPLTGVMAMMEDTDLPTATLPLDGVRVMLN